MPVITRTVRAYGSSTRGGRDEQARRASAGAAERQDGARQFSQQCSERRDLLRRLIGAVDRQEAVLKTGGLRGRLDARIGGLVGALFEIGPVVDHAAKARA